jgi:hypothetical protein
MKLKLDMDRKRPGRHAQSTFVLSVHMEPFSLMHDATSPHAAFITCHGITKTPKINPTDVVRTWFAVVGCGKKLSR